MIFFSEATRLLCKFHRVRAMAKSVNNADLLDIVNRMANALTKASYDKHLYDLKHHTEYGKYQTYLEKNWLCITEVNPLQHVIAYLRLFTCPPVFFG